MGVCVRSKPLGIDLGIFDSKTHHLEPHKACTDTQQRRGRCEEKKETNKDRDKGGKRQRSRTHQTQTHTHTHHHLAGCLFWSSCVRLKMPPAIHTNLGCDRRYIHPHTLLCSAVCVHDLLVM